MFNKALEMNIERLEKRVTELENALKYNFGLYDHHLWGIPPTPINIREYVRELARLLEIEEKTIESTPHKLTFIKKAK